MGWDKANANTRKNQPRVQKLPSSFFCHAGSLPKPPGGTQVSPPLITPEAQNQPREHLKQDETRMYVGKDGGDE